MFSEEQIASLNAKLDPGHVQKPKGQFGPKGDYIEGWHAISEANRIFGFDGWSYHIVEMSECHPPAQNEKGNFAVAFIARVGVSVGSIHREDTGYGSGFAKQIGDAYESATKEAVTDALKRALRTFGNPFGLALYDKSRANVGVENAAPASSNGYTKEKSAPKQSKADARETFKTLQEDLRHSKSREELRRWCKDTEVKALRERLPDDWNADLTSEVRKMADGLPETLQSELEAG
ncbi:RAD52 family DNA repair protein [Pararhizobium mangrovi]|uniref:DNA repair protein Rad52 n=1 Tax=Pararhizobium mangrovi TaxID=2590452 RepID=A0A506TZW4_9HYPH|nr:RAD52 family DNA repair protein [Pararhizobium mangrovi]TPW26846.1 DNA repair protein Rad52 [Pararhizobium mangrovi]